MDSRVDLVLIFIEVLVWALDTLKGLFMSRIRTGRLGPIWTLKAVFIWPITRLI